MTIAEAKEQIKNAMTAYFTKDEFGNYQIPIEKQRPVLMIGPPGIGKTAIMEQIASELNVGLVSYSMTHHTRQSALGLPYITTKNYGGQNYQVSEYTMSEIVGAVYDLMEETGVKEGILFLDEINCISETLAPCMLQFLQYKVFGQHRIPSGWIVVTAGNPMAYNKSVRDFDIVTWDRLKRIDVEPDYEAWKIYASQKGVHPAVTTYLSARRKDFYKVESTVDGKRFVTSRGWDDLSEMIKLYEINHLTVDEKLTAQYLQDPKTAKDFAIYYDLFNKYRSDYKIELICAGQADENILFRAQRAPFDERMSLLGLLFDAVTLEARKVCELEDFMDALNPLLKKVKNAVGLSSDNLPDLLMHLIEEEDGKILSGHRASNLTVAKQKTIQRVMAALQRYRAEILGRGSQDQHKDFDLIRQLFAEDVAGLKKAAKNTGDVMHHVFGFLEEAFASESDGDEMLIFVTELTANYYTARFIGHYGCEAYYLHNKELQFRERQQELIAQVDALDFEL